MRVLGGRGQGILGGWGDDCGTLVVGGDGQCGGTGCIGGGCSGRGEVGSGDVGNIGVGRVHGGSIVGSVLGGGGIVIGLCLEGVAVFVEEMLGVRVSVGIIFVGVEGRVVVVVVA